MRPKAKRKSPRRHSRGTLFWRIVAHNGGLVFAPEELALGNANLHRALSRARTWGEFRMMVPRAEYSAIVQRSFDNCGERRPRSSDRFSAEQVAGWSDGDYPEWLQQNMDIYLPDAVLRRYGKSEGTMLNGKFWMIPPESGPSMIRELNALGFKVIHKRNLPFS
jgi:hypothetical protein